MIHYMKTMNLINENDVINFKKFTYHFSHQIQEKLSPKNFSIINFRFIILRDYAIITDSKPLEIKKGLTPH
ncbi:hypothetical protein RCH19_000337 [Flavobacterium sp. PL12]